MKKIIKAIISSAAPGAVSAFLCAVSASAAQVQYYDVSAYINNFPIPCYSINNYCAVYAADLRNYGFNVDYNNDDYTVNITKNPETDHIDGIPDVTLPYQQNGTVYAETGDSAIKVFVNGEEIPSYWVDGSMMVLLDHIPIGTVGWDGEKKALFLTMDNLPMAEYQPLKKARREYSRYKPSVYELQKDHYYDFKTESIGWGFTRVEGDEPVLYDWQKSLLERFDAYYMDRSKPHKIYLTFDEGYENGYTPMILDTLTKYDVPATFFVTKPFIDEAPHLVREMIDRGFTVGNHTVTHPNLAKCSIENVMSELDGVSNALRDQFGYKTVFMRPPEGAISERVLAIAKDMGYNTILWSFAYADYDNVVRGADYAYNIQTRYMHDGAIYLIHAISQDNAYALERVIQYAIEHGYEFGSLDDLCEP